MWGMSESPRRGLRRLRYSPRRTGGPQPAPVAGQATPDPSAASVLRRVAALLRGGVPSSRVWGVLGQEGVSPPAAGCPEWRVAAAAWRLARTSGVPLSPALERLAAALGALEQVAERREVLLAGPRATIRLVAALPPGAMLLGFLLGFDPLAAVLTPVGGLCAVLGCVLLLIGVWWARGLAARLARVDHVAGLEYELVWIALGGGAAPAVALRRVADCADHARAEWVRLEKLRHDGPVCAVLASAAALGTPVGPLLLSEAETVRRQAHTELETAAERLAVRILLPLATCILPSFILLGVMPVLLAVLGGVTA